MAPPDQLQVLLNFIVAFGLERTRLCIQGQQPLGILSNSEGSKDITNRIRWWSMPKNIQI